ncbi:MAG: right-handed parallel beta-helix repeat-containing protein [Lentisphaerae bacterium]|nr:right-handed parallel beta-helix repeat-containing protein [Lentisphaerota bacterium]
MHHNGNLNVDEMTGGYGIYVNGDGLVIENNTVTHNGALPSGGGGGGIEGYGMINTLIRSNECSFNFGNGILIEDSVATVAEYNTANSNDCRAPDGTWFAAALWLDGGHHVTVRRNRFDHNLGPGIEISDEESAAPYAYEVSSNNANSNYWGIYLWGFTRPAAEPINITGNTLSDNSGGAMRIEDLAASPEDLNIHIE